VLHIFLRSTGSSQNFVLKYILVRQRRMVMLLPQSFSMIHALCWLMHYSGRPHICLSVCLYSVFVVF